MGEGSYALIEMTLTFGVLIVFLLYQLHSVRRARRDPRRKPPESPPGGPADPK